MSDRGFFRLAANKRAFAGLVMGGVLYFAFLLITAPASLAGWAVAHFSHQQVQLQGVSGSLWHGEAHAVQLKGPGGQDYQLAPLAWKIGFGRLLHGQLLADIAVGREGQASRAVIAVSRHQMQLEQFHSQLPPAALQLMVPQLDISKVTGRGR